MGRREFGLDPDMVSQIAREIASVRALGLQVCVVCGGGNIFRGMNSGQIGLERTTGDYIGMLATVMNALALQGQLESQGVHTRVQSAIPMASVAEPYIRRRAVRHMEKGRVVIFAAGTGNPYFTTDTAAALRASEMHCDALLMAKTVDGVYDADPKLVPTAKRYDQLSYRDVLAQELKVMDTAAIALTREGGIPVLVFSIYQQGEFARVVQGTGRFTLITEL